MKLISTRNNLRNAFQTAERFTGKNMSLPILSHIFFEAGENKARCVATNLEMGVEFTVPCKVVKSGSLTLPAKLVNTVIQSLDEETITMEVKDSILSIRTDSSTFSIQGIAPNDFPTLPKIKKEAEFSFVPGELKRALIQVVPALATSDFKPELTGVFVKKDAKKLTLAATDSFRLAEKTLALPSSPEGVSMIIPGRACHELLRIIPDGIEAGTILYGENQMVCEFPNTLILARLIDGAYPDYETIIPKTFETALAAGREEFVRKIKAASAVASKLNDISICFSPGETYIEATNAEVGKSRIQLGAKVKGKEGKVSFNFRYLLDGLEALGGEEVMLSLGGDQLPALLSDPSDPSFRYILMPIRSV